MSTNDKTLGVVITVYNEGQHIQECIKSAQLLTDNITVIDTQSTDNTKQLALEAGVQVYSYPYLSYVEPSRNFAIEKVDADWVLILDADERITQEAADEILKTIGTTDKSHFLVPRKNIMARKRWLRYGGWYPDNIIRLILKKDFVDWPKAIHSTPQINGEPGILNNPLIHYFQPSLEFVVNKTATYEDIESDLLFMAHKKVNTIVLFRKFLGELYRRLILKRGYMDGTYGIIQSLYQAFSKTITYIFLYEKYEESTAV